MSIEHILISNKMYYHICKCIIPFITTIIKMCKLFFLIKVKKLMVKMIYLRYHMSGDI